MGQFNEAVVALIEAFNRGIGIIKTHRRRRKAAKAHIGSGIEAEEERLSRSLKKGKTDIASAYARELAELGSQFTEGDESSSSSLAAILFRLNAGFVIIMDRFTRGKCSRKDYQNLVSLSDRSRVEAVRTFRKLSLRLSRSSKAKSSNKNSSKGRGKHGKAKARKPASVPRDELPAAVDPQEVAPVQPDTKSANSADTVTKTKRPRAGRKASSRSSKPLADDIKVPGTSTQDLKPSVSQPQREPHSHNTAEPAQHGRRHTSQRISFMSFASDSTKLGEIPERKWARNAEDSRRHSETAYPLSPWQDEHKPRFRFMHLFKKQSR